MILSRLGDPYEEYKSFEYNRDKPIWFGNLWVYRSEMGVNARIR